MNAQKYRIKLVKEKKINYNAVKTPKAAAEILKKILKNQCEEFVYLLCLDNAGTVVGVHEISHGTIATSLFNPPEILKRALLNNASGIILGHNHPSGSTNPSPADFEATERIKKACEIVGVMFLDHIIIGKNAFSMMAGGEIF